VHADDVTRGPGAAARLSLLLVIVLAVVVVVIGTSLEWGSLAVRGRLVISEGGLGEWQGVVALAAALAGATCGALGMAARSMVAGALGALVAGVVIVVVSVSEVVHLVGRPEVIAEVVRAGARSIPLPGYVVPLIESTIGPGVWVTLAGGAVLAAVGLATLVWSTWRRRARAV